MADTKPIELRYYPQADSDLVVFSVVWKLVKPGSSDPVEHDISDAHLDIIFDGRAKGRFTLGEGLTWNSEEKSILVEIRNRDVTFIRDEADMEFSFYVAWDYGAVQTIREGTVSAVRVA